MPVVAGDVTTEGTLAADIAAAFLETVPDDSKPDVETPVNDLAKAIAEAIAKAVNDADADEVLTG